MSNLIVVVALFSLLQAPEDEDDTGIPASGKQAFIRRRMQLLTLNSNPSLSAEGREEARLCAEPYTASRNH